MGQTDPVHKGPVEPGATGAFVLVVGGEVTLSSRLVEVPSGSAPPADTPEGLTGAFRPGPVGLAGVLLGLGFTITGGLTCKPSIGGLKAGVE